MSYLTDRLAQITDSVRAAVAASSLDRKELVTISNTGLDFLNSRSQAAGAIIVYPFPTVTWPAPKARRVVWTIGIVAAGAAIVAASRVDDLVDVVRGAGIVRWNAADATATSTNFAVSEDKDAPSIPGYAITITEEHLT